MNTLKTSKLSHALAFFLLSVLLCCCSDEREEYQTPSGGQEKTVTFSVRVTGSGTPKTYALTEGNENEVKQIAVLLFDPSTGYTYQPVYSNNLTTNPTDSKLKTFTIKVPEGTYDMVVLANANTSLNAALSSITIGDSKATVLDKLLINNNLKWNTTAGSGGYIPIPMWGEITGIVVGGTMAAQSVTLVRMVAKIDVVLTTASAQSKFNLSSVRLYNYNNQGQVVPNAANWNSVSNIVTAPSVPSTAQKLGNPTTPTPTAPLLFDGVAITKDPSASGRGVSCINEIYTFEAGMGSVSTLLDNTCLVVGGRYTGDSQDTYYRIDLANTTTGASHTTTYLPVLRNHNYKINITNVSGSGLGTPEDAFKARPVNIKASVVQWSDGRFTSFVVNDQYLLGVSQGEFTFSREARTAASNDNTLSIITDYPSGWKIEKIVDAGGNASGASWLTTSLMQGFNPSGNDLRLLMPINNSGSSRTAFIHIKAERLTYIVTVTQLTTVNMGISITDTNIKEVSLLEFVSTKQEVTAGTQPAAQMFKVDWSPTSSNLLFTLNTLGTNPASFFAGGTGLDQILNSGSLTGGTKTYNIRPTVITLGDLTSDPFYERSSILIYQLSDGVASVNKTLTLRQYVYNMVPVVESVYLMEGGQKSFGVRSNSPFRVVINDNPNNVISGLSTTGAPNISPTGTPVTFNIYNDFPTPSLYQEEVKLTIESTSNPKKFPDTPVSLNCVSGIIQPKANSYIVAPNSTPILIPVSRANESMLGAQLGASDIFSVELVWTDKPHTLTEGIGANGAVKMIQAAGTGPGTHVLVQLGSGEGNAVVCIKKGGTILWSWHIWVTSYAPSSSVASGTFMDRNLGAIGNTPGQVATKGLLYQWGRKDAFPGSTSINGTVEPTLYKASGTVAIAKLPVVSVANNFANSVANPATFYYKTTSPYDWYSNGSTQNDTLWGPVSKTAYDPCPAGWRVPQNGVWGTLTTSNFPWNGTTLGRSITTHGGFYPASGYRHYNGGQLYDVGSYGTYWSATPNGVYGCGLTFSSSGVSPSLNTNRAYGFSVRCVAE